MNEFDITAAPLEIERKFLIAYPDIAVLQKQEGYHLIHIEQTYLNKDNGSAGGRIRRITDDESVKFIYTCKQKITEITRYEYEKEISSDEYDALIQQKQAGSSTIIKDRHIFRYGQLTYELDIYEFWQDKATLEAEVDSENTVIPIPPFITLIKEVTFDSRYNNSRLAYNLGEIE
ncbi:MAG: CYTH domain-containing protein [Ruminococcus sp.]|nr:CYTH domain-containing protein [Ruminococcus sp.]